MLRYLYKSYVEHVLQESYCNKVTVVKCKHDPWTDTKRVAGGVTNKAAPMSDSRTLRHLCKTVISIQFSAVQFNSIIINKKNRGKKNTHVSNFTYHKKRFFFSSFARSAASNQQHSTNRQLGRNILNATPRPDQQTTIQCPH